MSLEPNSESLAPEPSTAPPTGTPPRLRLTARVANQALRPWADRLFTLNTKSLLEHVAQRSGLADFGDRGFEEPLRCLLEEPRTEGLYHVLGRYRLHHEVRRLLRTRLRLMDLLKRHPEIENQTIEAPIFVMGLPGSGSNHVHQMLCQHPSLRRLPAWEAREPLPRQNSAEPDLDIHERQRRLARNARRRRLAIRDRYEASGIPIEETLGDEQELMGIEFSSLLLEMKYETATYRRWRMTQPQRPSYESLRRFLQALQWLRGGERWVLHSTQHIDQLEVLLRVFPDARVIHVHRDPYVVARHTSWEAHQHRELAGKSPANQHLGQLWLDRTESRLRSCVQTRMRFPDLPVTDIRHSDYIANPIETAEICFHHAAEPVPVSLPDKIRDFHTAAEHGKHDDMPSELPRLAPHRARVEERLGFYRDFFSVVPETSS